jgi:hypothetical protein
VYIDLTQDPDADDMLVDVKKYLEGPGTLTTTAPGRNRKIMKLATKTFLHKGELYKRRPNGDPVRIIISKAERQRLLHEVHEGLAHFGEKSTYDLISNTAWWPGIQADTITHVKTCEACQAFARLQKPEAPIRIPVSRLFERISLDYVGPLPLTASGNEYILVAIDALTRFPFARAVPHADAKTTAKFLYEETILQFGPPETILTDRGKHFVNRTIKFLTKILEVKHLLTTPYHPQANGMTERFNGALCNALSRLAAHHEQD